MSVEWDDGEGQADSANGGGSQLSAHNINCTLWWHCHLICCKAQKTQSLEYWSFGMLNLRSMLAATFAVTFFCSVQHSFADEKIQLRGVFYEKLSGEESYDFDQRVYYGMDDGCTIDKIKPLQKKKYELHMSCGTADVGGPPVKVKRTMSAIKNGWRITSQNGETSDYIKSAE